MANKNRNLILSYFPTVDDANEAAQHMKQWDKDRKDIKLGGMGVITMEDGKLKTHKVGSRAGGTGAKWGLILGAAAGILSGGLTLIGGALAGLAAGAVGGALFHKKLGMTDDDKLRLEMHLNDGGAALAVMVDDEEMGPTRAELFNCGGEVEHYIVPDETMDELEDTAAGGEVQDVDEGEFVIVETVEENDLKRINGVGEKYAALLEASGVDTIPELAQSNPENLYQKLAEVNEEKELVADLPSPEKIADWVSQAKELS